MGLSAQEILKTDPAFVQQQLAAQEMQRLNPSGSAAGAIGAVLGRGVGNISRGQGFFEANNPGLQRVTDVNNIMQSVQFDPKNPAAYYEQIGNALQQSGYSDLAPMAFSEAQKFKKTETSVFAKVDPSKFTPESIRDFQAQGQTDYSLLNKKQEEDKASPERVRETRIGELVNRGYPRDYSSDIVDGNIRIEVVPQTGEVRRINRLTGEVSQVPISNLPPMVQADLLAADEELQNQTLWEAAESGTGLWSAVRAGASRVVGQIPGVPQAEKTEEARQLLSTATNDLARALVINPRFPVAEVERIIREAGTQPGAFDTPKLMRSRLKVLDAFLKDRLTIAEQDASNNNLPQETRSAQASNASAIRSFLPRLGIPQAGIGKPPTGVTQKQWEAMSPAQRSAFK